MWDGVNPNHMILKIVELELWIGINISLLHSVYILTKLPTCYCLQWCKGEPTDTLMYTKSVFLCDNWKYYDLLLGNVQKSACMYSIQVI